MKLARPPTLQLWGMVALILQEIETVAKQTPTQRLQEIQRIIEDVDNRAIHADGPVPATLQVMTQDEISRIYLLSGGKQGRRKMPSPGRAPSARESAIIRAAVAAWRERTRRKVEPLRPRERVGAAVRLTLDRRLAWSSLDRAVARYVRDGR